MGRPPISPGTFGTFEPKEIAPGRWKARARYRHHDGTYQLITRYGHNKTTARDRLNVALMDVQAAHGSPLSRQSTVRELAERWLAEVDDDARRAAQTKEHYRYTVNRYVLPTIGSLRLVEATTGRVDLALRKVRSEHGDGAGKSARAVMNGMFGMARRHDAISDNPVQGTSAITAPKKTVRALRPDEVADLTARLREDDRAVELDLPDLVDFCLGTGCRIGEALAVRESVLDLDAARLEINATIIRVKGGGLVVQERPKSAAGHRLIALPRKIVGRLRERAEELRFRPPEGVVFGSPFAPTLRDPSNTAGALREALDRLGYPDVSFHTFRKTVATRLDQAGYSARQIADHLGHAQPSLTQDVYMGRKIALAEAAEALER